MERLAIFFGGFDVDGFDDLLFEDFFAGIDVFNINRFAATISSSSSCRRRAVLRFSELGFDGLARASEAVSGSRTCR